MNKKIVLIFWMLGAVFFLEAQYQVGHMTKTFNDPTRTGGFGSGGGPGRQIQTEIYYPATTAGNNVPCVAGEHPVIVFGHGFAMAWDAYENIWMQYAAKGYILAFPRTEGGLIPGPSHNDFGLDLKLVGEKMVAEGAVSSSILHQKVKNAVVIMGHSMGGGATMLAGASNSNIKGIVGLAPAETNPSAIAAAANITVPALIFSGGQDGVTPPAEHHLPIYNALGSSCKSFVNIVGGAHCYFANSNFNCDFGEGTASSGISITRAQQQARTYGILDPWLEFILKDNCEAYSAYLNALSASPSTLISQTTCSSNPTPSINESAGLLTSSVSGVNYQWFLNGNPINGANSQSFTPQSNGNYSVQVFFTFGCSLSAPFTIIGLGIDSENFESIMIYPNPSSTEIFIGNGNLGSIEVRILDLSGKEILKVQTSHRIDMSSLDKGVYMIQLNGKNYRIVHLPD